MPAGSSVAQLLDARDAARRNAEAVAERDQQIATGQALMRELIARYRRLTADPRGIDRELLAACETWAEAE